jgi:type III secretory pathway component EscR
MMDTSEYQLPDSFSVNNKDLIEIYETFKAIDEIYNNSLIAMGMQTRSAVSVSGNTNISLSNIGPISTK